MRLFTLLLGLCLAISARAEQDSLSLLQLDEQFSEAQQLIQAFQFDQAILLLTDCLHYDEENLEYQLQMAYCYLQTGRYQ
ncbi:MAG: tetratricopeptide repeat protein, partial [Bacteroidota bacterium]